MKIMLYHIDSFTDSLFKGNPAVVCPLDRWLTNDQMQKIANENCVSETAFLLKMVKNLICDGLHQKRKLIFVVMQHLRQPTLL